MSWFFVPAVLFVAIATFVVWFDVGPSPSSRGHHIRGSVVAAPRVLALKVPL